ncbi:MAG TPA: hypothetical protein VGJ18_07980 [Gemmatimonadaceae bacterium]|jgi:hypothetical protein
MANTPFITSTDTALRRGTLIRLLSADQARVLFEDGPSEEIECDVLHTAPTPLLVAPGDAVLVWRPGNGDRAVVLGRVGPSAATTQRPAPNAPDELVLEATNSLTLRVGDGSITIRDGKILIKGTDLVSHAQRMNRIKGGAVSIN